MFKEYVRIIRRHLWFIFAVVIVVTVTVFLITMRMDKVFEATAVLRIEMRKLAIGVSLEELYWSSMKARDYFNTECRTIKSRRIASQVLERLNLASNERYRGLADPVGALANDIEVVPDIDSNLVRISYRSTSRELAATVVNAVIDEYLAFKKQSESVVTEEAQRRILRTTEEMEQRLSESEKRLKDFETRHRVSSYQKELERVSQEVSSYQAEITRLNIRLAESETKWRSFKEALDQIEKLQGLPEIASNELVRHYLKTIAELEQQKVALLKKFAPSSIEVATLDAQLEQMRSALRNTMDRIVESVSVEFERYKQEKEKKQELLLKVQEREKELLQLLNEYERLRGDVETNRKLYNDYLGTQRQLESAAYSTPRTVEVIDRASVPTAPVSPKMSLNLMIAFFASLLASIGLVFLIEHFDDSVRDDITLKKAGNLEPIGTIPYIKADKQKRRELITFDAPKSGPAEAFRAVMISIISLLKEEEGSKIILITSAETKEGKSLISSNLAAAFARWGKKTLVIDSDMRHPSLHRTFGIEKEKGLSDYIISKDEPIDAFVRKTPIEGLSILTSGTIPHSPADLLGSERMKQLIPQLKQEYEIVLIDSPPTLGMADTMLLSSYATAVILAVLVGKTSIDALKRSIDLLRTSDAKILGAVLNEVSPRRSRYYYYSYYYRYYRPYGEKE
jgi:capsular exopolysaccharide synthesis family protein